MASRKFFLIMFLFFFTIPQILLSMEQKKRDLNNLDETFIEFYAAFDPTILEGYLDDIREIRASEGDSTAYQELFNKIEAKVSPEAVENPRIKELTSKLDAIVELKEKKIKELEQLIQDIQEYGQLTNDETRYRDLVIQTQQELNRKKSEAAQRAMRLQQRREAEERQKREKKEAERAKAARLQQEREALERQQREREAAERQQREREEQERQRRQREVQERAEAAQKAARLQREKEAAEHQKREREEQERQRRQQEREAAAERPKLMSEKERQAKIRELEQSLINGLREIAHDPNSLNYVISDMKFDKKIETLNKIEEYLELLPREQSERQERFLKPAIDMLSRSRQQGLNSFINSVLKEDYEEAKKGIPTWISTYKSGELKILKDLINERIKRLSKDDPNMQIFNELLNQIEVKLGKVEPAAEELRKEEKEAVIVPIQLIPTGATAMKNLNLCPFRQCVDNLGIKNGLSRQLLQISMAKQIGARCGGLSLINALWTEKYVTSGNRSDLVYLHNTRNVKNILDNIGCGNWVNIDQVKAYIESAKNKGYDVANIDAISSVLVLDSTKAEFLFKEEVATGQSLKDKIRQGLAQDYFFHGIIVGNEEKKTGAYGHYFAFVIIKSKDQVQYVVIDSLDTNHLIDVYKRQRINYLIDQLETGRAESLIPFTEYQQQAEDIKNVLDKFNEDRETLNEENLLNKYWLDKLLTLDEQIKQYRLLTESPQEFENESDTIIVLLGAQKAHAEEIEKKKRGQFEEIRKETDSAKRRKEMTRLIIDVGVDKNKLGSQKSYQLAEEFIEAWCGFEK